MWIVTCSGPDCTAAFMFEKKLASCDCVFGSRCRLNEYDDVGRRHRFAVPELHARAQVEDVGELVGLLPRTARFGTSLPCWSIRSSDSMPSDSTERVLMSMLWARSSDLGPEVSPQVNVSICLPATVPAPAVERVTSGSDGRGRDEQGSRQREADLLEDHDPPSVISSTASASPGHLCPGNGLDESSRVDVRWAIKHFVGLAALDDLARDRERRFGRRLGARPRGRA